MKPKTVPVFLATTGLRRRALLQSSAALALIGLGGNVIAAGMPSKATVVVIGGGFGGATAAKYVRLLSGYKIEVVLIEPQTAFVSSPMSNLVVGGRWQMADITMPFASLSKNHGVTLVRDYVSAIDSAKKTVTLASGVSIGYDKLVLSPGVDLQLDAIQGLVAGNASGQILHAWKAGAQTAALRQQLADMPDGGVYAITIPPAPYRCPPGPYERASLVAAYFKAEKPRSKVLILDANPDVVSKAALFKKVWAEDYAGILDYRCSHNVSSVDGKTGMVYFDFQDAVKADVLNVLPPMRACGIAIKAGLNNQANQRWCGVNFLNFESTVAKDVHVLGDAIQVAPAMPKSAHMANHHGKVAAAAIVAELAGRDINPAPMLTDTCYSFVDGRRGIHEASVYEYIVAEKTFRSVAGAGQVCSQPSEIEGSYAINWAKNIWADTLV
ncbi:Sulfide dehydrogenase [flavocytochrome c] flavoprotein chain [Polaromonas vacuolata]|uniref:Sulfide dehydrogenase [flavocytochrome c] flavoprotein chain n=1 Tax=Polaromonas vacuolata TaxID=37448 RepID=A0A6H2HDN1_9BURK|nr:NAD(P)/FAD-dependent oxidoreductase [Polaromonas vacuolata]QJC57999.1 Sulfide dehydrogenase [flavocytochrome c] flavoprotein chain [Polaromonas vacuolata]